MLDQRLLKELAGAAFNPDSIDIAGINRSRLLDQAREAKAAAQAEADAALSAALTPGVSTYDMDPREVTPSKKAKAGKVAGAKAGAPDDGMKALLESQKKFQSDMAYTCLMLDALAGNV